MNNSSESPFRILDWRILSFQCANPIPIIPENIQHNWKLKANISSIDVDGDILRAFLRIDFHFDAEAEGATMNMDGQSIAVCEMNSDGIENAKEVFQGLLSRTAMTNSLANLRVFLLQAGTLHSMGFKRTMLPFINLNNFPFDEDVTFTS